MAFIVATLGFWSLIWSKVLFRQSGSWYSACPNCWGDWSAHLAYTTSFAYGANWPLQLPTYAGHQFSYPFLFDLASAGLVKLGVDLPESLVWPGWLTSIGLTGAIFFLAKRLTQSNWVGVFTLMLFLFNGGWGDKTQWLNFITAQLLPQRGQLPGLILAIAVYYYLWKKRPALAGILAGFLPLIHAHSYLVTLMIGFWSGWRFWLPALALGLPQIGLVYGFDAASGWFRFNPVWLSRWFELGPVLPLFLIGLAMAPKTLRRFYLPFWLVFLAGSLFIFQPFDWDNTKLFIHWYLIAAIGAAALLARRPLFGLLLLPWLILPGIESVTKIAQGDGQYQFFNSVQLATAEKIHRLTPPLAIFITAENHNHWLPALTGRTILLGYPGWLWTYGINYSQRQADIAEIYRGNSAILSRYHADYLVIGPDEKTQFTDLNAVYFRERFTLIFDENGYQVFKLQ